MCCSVLQIVSHINTDETANAVLVRGAEFVACSVLQRVAVCCSVLQCVGRVAVTFQ